MWWWIVWVLVLTVGAFYVGAVMSSGRWNPWRSPGKRRAR